MGKPEQSFTKASNENNATLIEQLKVQSDVFTISERLVITSKYVIRLEFHYGPESINSPMIEKLLLRLDDEMICSEMLDPVTYQPMPEKTEKYYYSIYEDGSSYDILKAKYKQNGSLDYITYVPTGDRNDGHDWESFNVSDFSKLQSYFSNDISYFLTSTLEPGYLDL